MAYRPSPVSIVLQQLFSSLSQSLQRQQRTRTFVLCLRIVYVHLYLLNKHIQITQNGLSLRFEYLQLNYLSDRLLRVLRLERITLFGDTTGFLTECEAGRSGAAVFSRGVMCQDGTSRLLKSPQ